MNQEQRDYVEQFLRELQSGKDPKSIIRCAYLNDWAGNDFDFFVEVNPFDNNRYATTRVKAAIERMLLFYSDIFINMYEYNTPRTDNSWKFSGIVSPYIGDSALPIHSI